jgi:Bacterial DNA-binding protein
VRGVLAGIERAVGKSETLNLVGFGRFELYQRSARRGRNLGTARIRPPATMASVGMCLEPSPITPGNFLQTPRHRDRGPPQEDV